MEEHTEGQKKYYASNPPSYCESIVCKECGDLMMGTR